VQRSIEILVGRLATDETFRRAFRRDARRTLEEASEWGLPLTPTELTALLSTDPSLWDRIAEELDGRLRKASHTPS
jgi:hypothetical protein